jgi:molecular chaperone DnaK
LAAIEPVRVMLEEKKINAQDLELIIVGGQSKMPKVVEDLEAFFGKKSIKDNTISPDEAVVSIPSSTKKCDLYHSLTLG